MARPLTHAVGRLTGAFLFHSLCLIVMCWLELWAEARPAPSLPDVLVAHIAYVPWIDRWNYLLWTFAYAPVAVALFLRHRERFIRYLIAGGIVCLVRGLCIAATGLGPVRGGPDIHVGLTSTERFSALWQLVTPMSGFVHFANPFYLTKDLFFSGHISSTFILLLYAWPFPRLRAVALVTHVLVVLSVFFAHLHYTIDVIGAYAICFTIFVLYESKPGALRQLTSGAA